MNAFYKNLQNIKLKQLVGEQNFANYEKEFKNKLPLFFEKLDEDLKVMNFRKALDSPEEWLKPFSQEYDVRLKEKFKTMGIDSTNMDYYYELASLNNTKFKTFEEGRQYLNFQVPTKVVLPNYRAKLSSFVRKKTISDLYGENPTKEQIESLEKVLNRETWLLPEGKDILYQYMSDSENYFSDKIERKGITYFYTMVKETGMNLYTLTIKSIEGEFSHLKMQTQVKLHNYSEHSKEYIAEIHLASFASYRWLPQPNNYLRVFYKRDSPNVTAMSMGTMDNFKNTNHGYSAEYPYQKTTNAQFKPKDVLRTAIKLFILEYNNSFEK
jgi:hypothetical protein